MHMKKPHLGEEVRLIGEKENERALMNDRREACSTIRKIPTIALSPAQRATTAAR